MLLKDKVAIVTGSSSGIGKGTALRLAREGAKVVLNGRTQETLDATADEVGAIGADFLAIQTDITDPTSIEDLFARTMDAFGGIDLLVNNAVTPVNMGEGGPFLKMNPDGWDAYMQANLGALFRCTHTAARIMAKQGTRGSIINISTVGADRVHRYAIAYDAMKGAMETFTRAVAVDLAPWGIRVNGIRPGPIMVEKRPEWDQPRPHFNRHAPLGRFGYPEDIAWAVVFLASDDASYVTGQIFDVDGGLTSQLFLPTDEEAGEVITPETIGEY